MLPRLVLLTLAPLALFAQGGLTFRYQISGSTDGGALSAGGTVVYPTIAAGSASLATIYCTNSSTVSYSLSAAVTNSVFGTSTASMQLAPNSTTPVDITFLPKLAGTINGAVNLTLTAAGSQSQVVQFLLTGQALDGILTSVTFADGNQSLIPENGTITFPATPPGEQAAGVFMITNRSSAAISVDSVFLTGTGFRIYGLPLMPVMISPGGQLSAGMTFAPDKAGPLTGNLTYSIGGVTHRIAVTGSGAAAALTYTVVETGQTLQPGATISFPSVAVGSTAALTVRVTNTGTASTQISTVDASPSSFKVQSSLFNLSAGGSSTVAVSFAPQAAGTITGVMHIGTSAFTLSGVGLGAQLTCTVTARGQVAPGCDGGTITLPSTALGDKLTFSIQIANTGNQSGSLQNFTIGGNGYGGSLSTLPVTLAPGASVTVNATFAPTVIGITGGFVQINNQISNLTAAATAPPSLPAVTFTNLQAEMSALQQPLIGLHLAAAYPYDLTGRLTLTFSPDALVDDPAIQFLNGQRYIDFKVPAGGSDAIFGTSSTGVVFQTGSTAGIISFSAAFNMGQYVLTGSSPVTKDVAIPAGAPVIRSVQIAAMDGSGFDLLITGASTGRSVKQLVFTLNPVADSSFTATTLTADVAASFDAWYQSSLSRSFGGLFTVSVRFNVSGDISTIQSVTATAVNAKGTSAPQTVNLQATTTP